jgi:hypothetical protein
MLKKMSVGPYFKQSRYSPRNKNLRLDICMGGGSIEQAQDAFKQQAKLACG